MRERKGQPKKTNREFVHVREQGRSFQAPPLFTGCHCCSGLVISGGQGVLFVFLFEHPMSVLVGFPNVL